MIEYSNNYFHITTQNTSYVMKVLPDGVLRHCYYGKRISVENMDFYNLYTGYTFIVPYMVNNEPTSLDALPQECPSYGRSDYRNPAVVIENAEGRRVNDYKYRSHSLHKGVVPIEGMPYLNENTQTAQSLEIVLQDCISGVLLHLFYTVFEDVDVIARHIQVENITDSTVTLHKVMSMSLDFECADFEMLSLYGSWGNERAVERYPLHHGKTVISSTKGASGHHTCPFAALVKDNTDENNGEAYGVSLVYSGDFEIGAQLGQFEGTRLYAGINSECFSWNLSGGESFTSPQAVMTYSCEGLGQMSRNFHEMCRKHLGKATAKKKHPVVWNLWEAFYFDINGQKVLNTIDLIKDFGIDVLVLDDGWFGKRNDDTTSLGDWVINKEKFPDGFDNIINKCKQCGIKFGLWFEPEVVSPESELFKAHPDWCIHIEGIVPLKSRNEYLLDFSQKAVVDSVYNSVSAILKRYDISYVKWDMNRNFTDNGSVFLNKNQQGGFSHRYILGVYSLMQRLISDFPHIFFEGSSGGGGRFDFGILYYMSQIWTSDNSDALGRLSIQHGTSMLFPPETISCHVSVCPNHQTGRTTPFKSRGDVAQLFSFGYELNPNDLSLEEVEQVKEQIKKHRQLEEWIYDCDFYRIKRPTGKDSCSWQAVSKDKRSAAVLYMTELTKPEKVGEYLRLKGLDPNKRYKVLPLGIETSGDILMYAGLPIKNQYRDFTSIFFEIFEV